MRRSVELWLQNESSGLAWQRVLGPEKQQSIQHAFREVSVVGRQSRRRARAWQPSLPRRNGRPGWDQSLRRRVWRCRQNAVDAQRIRRRVNVPRFWQWIMPLSTHWALDAEPFTPPSRNPVRLAPGDYEVYVTSRRVFEWDVNRMDHTIQLRSKWPRIC